MSMPGPGTYNASLKEKITGLFKSKEEKGAFIENAKYIGSCTPGF
jgi:hypothetical protein